MMLFSERDRKKPSKNKILSQFCQRVVSFIDELIIKFQLHTYIPIIQQLKWKLQFDLIENWFGMCTIGIFVQNWPESHQWIKYAFFMLFHLKMMMMI